MRYYDQLLVQWISWALNKQTLNNVIESIREGKAIEAKRAPSNVAYLNKILREEIIKQFKDKSRPFLELILNSIDARPPSFIGKYIIDVRIGFWSVRVKDYGIGMSLDEILKYLIIPFSTEKEGIEEIGRFGVGFFSILYFCLHGSPISFYTHTEKEAFKLTFYSTEDSVTGLRLRVDKIQKFKNRRGTEIIIKKYQEDGLKDYITSNLQSFSNHIAIIRINKKQINEKYSWYGKEVSLELNGKKYNQVVQIALKPDSSASRLLANGVKVQEFSSGNIDVSFPPAIRLVEGRDEFKIDDNYKACTDKIFECFEDLVKNPPYDLKDHKMPEILADLAKALDMEKLCAIKNIASIKETLLKDKEYVLTNDDYFTAQEFMTPYMYKTFAVSPEAYTRWSEEYKGFKEFLYDHLSMGLTVESPIGYIGLMRNAYSALSGMNYNNLHLVYGPEESQSPFMFALPDIYVNLNHNKAKGEENPLKKLYCTLLTFRYINSHLNSFKEISYLFE